MVFLCRSNALWPHLCQVSFTLVNGIQVPHLVLSGFPSHTTRDVWEL
jgi:hypothetical protein